MILRPTNACFSFLLFVLFFAFSCTQKEKSKSDAKKVQRSIPKKDYLAQIIAFDTLSKASVKNIVDTEIKVLSANERAENQPFLYYLKSRKYSIAKKNDSVKLMLDSMAEPKDNSEIVFLKKVNGLDYSINNGITVERKTMDSIHTLTEKAEKANSKLTYRFYDLLAKAYYQNRNEKTSLQYVEKYFSNHPFKNHPVIKQRYYDISFLLASRINDYTKMLENNTKARNLAINIKDSLAIARTYDNEAQIYARKLDFANTLKYSRIYLNYLIKTNNLHDEAYNNLATSFIKNNMADSAIFYFKKAIALNKKLTPGKPKDSYYKGLVDGYKLKGDYKTALEMYEEANAIELETIAKIEAVKIAEIKEKYEVEKKDRNIKELTNRNQLSEQVIKQQKTTLLLASLVFIAVLLSLYFSYRQKQLKEKNNLLKSENKRLSMEQKLLQVQLNPHFIFNSIANLQSLASAGNTKETVRYLTVFSGLLRNVLEQSRKDFITLEEELATLDNYLQLQQMRFIGLFDYKITTASNLYITNTLIPPMLIQPFIENAIEHGFRNINYKGMLNITFNVVDEQLIIVVDDNGSGITAKNGTEPKKQSLAGTILKERLDLIFVAEGQDARYEQTDKKQYGEHGYTVKIVIPELVD